MIKKISNDNNHVIAAFLEKEAEQNFFMLGNIENHGYKSIFHDVWGDFDSSAKVKAVLSRYYGFFIITAYGEHDEKGFSNIIRNHYSFQSLLGTKNNIEKYGKILNLKPNIKYLMKLETLSDLKVNESKVELAKLDDVHKIDDLFVSIKEFGFKKGEITERYLNTVKTKEARYFIIRNNREIIACAATAAENSRSAMIVSVCCRDKFTGKGYATSCVFILCKTLKNESKSLCLLVDNPNAQRLYKKIGFEKIGEFVLLEKK